MTPPEPVSRARALLAQWRNHANKTREMLPSLAHAPADRTVSDVLSQGCDVFERCADELEPLVAHVERLEAALRSLMKESAAVLALAEHELRDAVGHTNVAVFKLRVDEASAALAGEEGNRG